MGFRLYKQYNLSLSTSHTHRNLISKLEAAGKATEGSTAVASSVS